MPQVTLVTENGRTVVVGPPGQVKRGWGIGRAELVVLVGLVTAAVGVGLLFQAGGVRMGAIRYPNYGWRE